MQHSSYGGLQQQHLEMGTQGEINNKRSRSRTGQVDQGNASTDTIQLHSPTEYCAPIEGQDGKSDGSGYDHRLPTDDEKSVSG